jgi:hypothetical protein
VFTTIEREQDTKMSGREEHVVVKTIEREQIFLWMSGGAYSTSLLKRMEDNALMCVREQIF